MIDHQTLGEAKQVCPTTTQRLVREGALLVDVRERTEVASLAFDVPAIVNIPLFEMEQRWGELPKDRELVLVCESGERSLKATYYLQFQGFTRVSNMEGGAAQVDAQGLRGHRPALRGTCSYGHFFVLWR
ncbi:rhodanese-like domain-containing protein [Comamonas sp. wu1-DMT]|uniref:rhodanese-like domain-containing protein n=1 Tax=Comamonas sp. wu1-DMT TaxID=3126390 RepID=UPI0032E438A5